MKTLHTVLFTAAGILLAGGAYMQITSPKSSEHATVTVTDAFITAVIRGDVNEMGRLVGVDPAQGQPMDRTFGKVLGGALEKYWSAQAQDPANFRWESIPEQVSDQKAQLRINLFVPDYGAQADKVAELLGYTTDEEGTLIPPETLAMSATEAERLAKEDTSIPPLHYRITLQLISQTGRWVVDPEHPGTSAVVSVIRRSDTLMDNEAYQVK